MEPLSARDTKAALLTLQRSRLMLGYRGKPAINMGSTGNLIAYFSEMVYDLQGRISSRGLNPLMCRSRKAVIANARIIIQLAASEGGIFTSMRAFLFLVLIQVLIRKIFSKIEIFLLPGGAVFDLFITTV